MTTITPPSQPNKLHVLVIAHPDDESMFFIPTIQALRQAGETLWILCLTTGDYDGLGQQRAKEMQQASKLLGFEKCIIRSDNKTTIQDHPSQRWKISDVSQAIETALAAEEHQASISNYQALVLITFDDMGVSGHVNHIDTYLGVQQFLISSTSPRLPKMLEAWQLESESNPIRKYIPMLSWIYLLLSLIFSQYRNISIQSKDTQCRIYRCHEPNLNWNAMATHHSQFVWYRRLFVVFSCYTYANVLRKMESTTTFTTAKKTE
ncbi:unnamed protein product [Cylindrotheca closterium]|uniref:N-acetylglucosaminylphosphatidylinositol deacetylase n=1 Tax=Cylindrotheca closterium TaxID=2856 RepID=A0AAD2G0J9_9STRA|nr:unnamed protein product [Cylindrotheca closterium]